MRSLRRIRERRSLIGLSLLGGPVVAAVLAAALHGGAPSSHARLAAAVPVPVYEIEADGGPNYGHHASLLNLKLGQPGVPQAPIPVDTDGDLLPDVTVAVNLVNIDGQYLNPPQLGTILAPNIQINRLITTQVLGQRNHPLKINVKLTVKDLFGSNPDTVVRFGYDTGPGGSIPQFWKATVAGLDQFFNPLQAVIDTTGQQLGLHPGITDFNLGPIAAPYQGPLKIIGGVQAAGVNADIAIAYRPFPNAVQIRYGTDDKGQHIAYAHGVDTEVDMTTTAKLTTGNSTTNAVARFDRLPRSMDFDVDQNASGGSVDYHSVPDKRLPDAQVDVTTTSPGSAPLVARANVETLPAAMHGEWNIADDAPAHVAFTASGTGVGAVEARVANYLGNPTKLVPWVPDQQQYASFQNVPIGTDGTEQLIQGRAERLRDITFDQDGGGYTGHVAIGDGELPFVANIGLDQRREGGDLITGRAQISPLPDSIDLAFSPPGSSADDPLTVRYDASQSVDIDAHVEVREAGAVAGATCGRAKTICADFAGRNIPAHLEARVRDGLKTADGKPETRIELDDIPRPGGVQPDFKARVVIGQNDLAPLIADASLDGLSRFVRLRAVQGADETLERMELHTCDYDYDARSCAAGSEDELGALRVKVRNFVTRPADLPEVASPAKSFAGIAARGDDANADLVRFEAVARMDDVREVQYVNSGGTFAARTRVGGGANLAVDVDVAGVRMPQFPGNRIDLSADALITPLPDTISLCVQNGGGVLVDGADPLTAPCQKKDPFGDGSVDAAPIVFDWQASSAFSTKASARAHLDQGTPGDPTDDLRLGADVKVDNIPSALNATVAVPVGGQAGGPIRVLTTGPAGSDIDVRMHGEMTRGGASCDDPNPSRDVACADATIEGLPTNLSMLVDSTQGKSRAEFHACDYRFSDATPACRPGTAGSVKVLAVDGQAHFGNPGRLAVLEPTTDQHAFLQYRQKSADDVALRVRARFEQLRNVTYRQAEDGFDAGYDMGTGVKPFEARVQADTRTGTLPDEDGLKAAAEVLITPLPAQLKVGLHGPGDGAAAAPMKITYDAASPVRVRTHAQVFRAAAGADPDCGDDATACATVDIQRIPAHLEATIGQSETAAGADAVDHRTVVDVTSDAPVGAKPDVVVDAIAGLPSTTPLVGATPVRAKLELLGLPRYFTTRLDEHVTKPGTPDEQRDLRTVSIRTCRVDASTACVAGTEDELDSLSLTAHNFITRPANFPAPNAGITEPLWATVTGRGVKFQAAVKLLHIREATYVNHQRNGTRGFRVRVGDDQNLQARVDVLGLPLGDLNFGGMAVQDATLDARANVLVKPVPSDIRVCLRQSGLAVYAPTGDVITAPCEDTAPFGPSVGTLDHTPMSVAYRASVPITRVETTADVALNGKAADLPGTPPIEARRLHGEIAIDNIPKEITAHVLTPVDDADGNAVGATRVRYDAPSTGPGLNVHFRAEQTQGDSVCQDPRPSATALCVGADLKNLPKHVELRYEPDKPSNNFHAETSTDFGGKMDFRNLELSSVKPQVDASGNRVPGKADVLVATGEILGMDDDISVDGSITMPHEANKAGSIALTASVRIDEINATVRNYVAPDPFTAPIPARPVYKDPASPANLNTFVVRGQPLPDGSPVFKAEVAVKNVKGFGYRQVADNTGAPTGTSVINVDFAKDFAARAYADVVLADRTHITGDVLLEHIPAGLQFCFRGSRPADTPAPAAGQPVTFCDDTTATRPQDGAFQFLGTPANPNLTGLDVDAFVRMAAPGGTDIVTGRVNITGIPYRVDGILPSEDNGGRLDIAAKNAAGDPLGIKQIKFAAATFDLKSDTSDLGSGYTSPTPGFVPITNQSQPFPPATFPTQYASVAASGDIDAGPFAFQAAGRFGDANDAVSSSRLQRIYTSAAACGNRANRTDFPLLPTNDGVSSYRCIGADLQQTDPSTPDPFALSVVYKLPDGTVLRLRNAGINDLPAYFQADLANTRKTQGPNDALRRRCGSAAAETSAYNSAHGTSLTPAQVAAQVTDCMPPLLRFDQPLASARLFGVVEFGRPADVATLAGVQPREALADLDAVPTAGGWGTPGDTPDKQGVRAKIADVDGRTAARVAFRLPVPQSVTVDQVQTAGDHAEESQDNYWVGSDLRFRYVVRDGSGNTVANLGELSALYQLGDGSQVLIGRPCRLNPHDRVSNNSLGSFSIDTPFDCNPDYRHGLLIPGEVGLSLYTRDNLGTGQKYVQVDGRLSTDESAALRLLSNDASIGRIEAELKNIPGPLDRLGNPDPTVGPDDATFRLEFLKKGEGQKPPTESPTPPAPESPPGDCILCITKNIRLDQAFVSFDMHPDAGRSKARRVEATLNTDGAANGLEVQSFDRVKGGANTAVEADAYLKIDPLDVHGYLDVAPLIRNILDDAVDWVVDSLDLPGWVSDILGVVVDAVARVLASLVNLDFTLESRLDATVQMKTSHATIRQNILHVKVDNKGSAADGSGNATLGPIDFYVHQLKANANLGLTIHTPWPFPDINIGFTLLTIYYVPLASDIVPFLIKYLPCSFSFDLLVPPLPGDTVSAGPGDDANVVIWPMADPRLTFGGIIGNIINGLGAVADLRYFGGLFFCIPGVDAGDVPLGAPGDTFQTVAGGLWPQHPIFDSAALADSVLTPGAPAGISAPPAVVATPTPPPAPPAPTPNGPNWTVFSGQTLTLCGLHAFGNLTVQAGGTIKVATAADATDTSGTGANCAPAEVGKLIITADNVTNHGTIDGDATQATQPVYGSPAATLGTAATGNSGGGHAGAGGAGSTGTGGSAYAKVTAADPERAGTISEQGGPGGATSGSAPKGGGLLLVLANDALVSDGVITAGGADGVSDLTTGQNGNTTANPCLHSEQTGTDGDGNPIITNFANGGVAAPAGAGAGGGIVLSATTLDLRGTTSAELRARGGVGGDSWKAASGSGGGGVVKLLAPVQLFDAGFSPNVAGGAAVAHRCTETTGGNAGGAGTVVTVATPVARAENVATFWNKGGGITVPFSAKAAYQSAGGFTAVLCGLRSDKTVPPAPTAGNPTPSLTDLFTVPTSNSAANPCGAGATQLATRAIPAGTASVESDDALGSITFSRTAAADNGTWGVWVVAVRPAVACGGGAPGCAVSAPPAKVDTVLGIDNSSPSVTITAPAPGFLTTSPSVTVTFGAADQDTPADQALSRVVKTECRNAGPTFTGFVPCSSGSTFNLAPGNGAKTVEIRVTDGAGNSASATVSGILSNSPPTATATVQFGPNGTNGYYTSAPTITLGGYSQGDGVPAEPSVDGSTGPYRWRFDNLPEQVCTSSPCVVPAAALAALPAGTHTFSFTAVDALGNRLYADGMQTLGAPIKWDPDRPTTQLTTVPLAPNATVGGLGWYTTRPYLVLSALDALGGSGLNTTRYRIDGAGSFLTYSVTNPPQLTPGVHTVEYFSTDLAGNVETTKSSAVIRVDDAAPDLTLAVSGGVLGSSGWYTTPPTITAGGFDDHGGTGAPAARSLRFRVDNGDEQSCDNPCDLAALVTGTHLVTAYAVDAVGNASGDLIRTLKVDTQAPHTTVALRAPAPTGLNGWYLTLPYIDLGADDQPADYSRVLPAGSGVDRTQYQLDGGAWVTYTGAFQVAGDHTLCVRSIDVAGNVEAVDPTKCTTVRGDDADPTTALSVAGPAGLGGWYTGTVTVTVAGADAAPGSGLVQAGASGTPCYDAAPAAPVPAGVCVAVDGRRFARYAGPIVLGEGVHRVEAYSVDAAGHRSAVVARDIRIDRSAPYTTARTVAPYPSRNGWFRAVPLVFLRAADGDQNSGVAATYYSVDGAAFAEYTGAFEVPNGRHTVRYYSVDVAGTQEAVRTLQVNVDTTPPVAVATSPDPAVWLKLLGLLGNLLGLSPAQAKLQWTVGDQYSPSVSVRVLVYDVTGNVVRFLDCDYVNDDPAKPRCAVKKPGAADVGVTNPITVTPGTDTTGYTYWDGRDLSLTGILPVGVYYYRVVVTDEAGNVAQSGESKPVTIKVG